jgi:hypothetical protein
MRCHIGVGVAEADLVDITEFPPVRTRLCGRFESE